MKHSAWHAFFLGWLVFGGGLIGYQQAGSIPSLVAGIVLGGVLFISTYLMLNDRQEGWYAGLATAVLILLQFAPSFQTSGDLFPAGLLSAVCLWVIGAFLANRIDRLEHSFHL